VSGSPRRRGGCGGGSASHTGGGRTRHPVAAVLAQQRRHPAHPPPQLQPAQLPPQAQGERGEGVLRGGQAHVVHGLHAGVHQAQLHRLLVHHAAHVPVAGLGGQVLGAGVAARGGGGAQGGAQHAVQGALVEVEAGARLGGGVGVGAGAGAAGREEGEGFGDQGARAVEGGHRAVGGLAAAAAQERKQAGLALPFGVGADRVQPELGGRLGSLGGLLRSVVVVDLERGAAGHRAGPEGVVLEGG
jgi:hypothetical protein